MPNLEDVWLSQDDAENAVFQAIWDIKIGNKTDDKLILENLRKNGIWLAQYAKPVELKLREEPK